jgi:TolB-like protein/Tfp pilus assembly protein PilF
MSFIEELKRRNVFRVGIAYAVSAWVLLQIVDLVLENIAAPEWVMQVFMLALAIGFPVAVLFAWAFEMTPDGLKLEKDVDKSQSISRQTGQKITRNTAIALAIAVVLLLVDKFSQPSVTEHPPEATSVENTVSTAPDTKSEEVSIAVLPFVDMSPEGDQAYFADGISEEILNVLVKTHSLKVAGRTSSFQFRGRTEDLRTIGEQLGVANILEGSIRKANNRVRITAQLVTADDGFHLWSETYDRELTDIFAIQDEIARSITDALAIELNLADTGETLVSVSTSNMEAYDRYLAARGLIAQRRDFPRAIKLLNEANQMDPEFAEGWAANAQAHSLSIYYMDVDRDEIKNTAEAMALKALELDPNLSMAHSVLGDIYRDRYQWIKAQQSYLHALTLNPDEIEANEQYTQMLWRASYFDEALKYSSRATELDPLSWLNLTVHAGLRYASGDSTGGWADIQRALHTNTSASNQDFALRHAIHMSISDGKIERAIELTKTLSTTDWSLLGGAETKAYYSQLIPTLSSREDTLTFLEEHLDHSISLGFSSPWATDIFWAAYYGDFELAEKIMEKGTQLDEKLGVLDTTWFNYPITNPLRNSAPYKNLVRRIDLDDFWREHGFPKNCRPLGEDDFACN